jgi:YVTN family beta-propeller protein
VKADLPFLVERKKVYVMELSSNYGESVDNVTFRPVFRIFMPERPVSGLRGYVSNYGSDAVMIIDKKRMEVSGVIAAERGPRAMAIDPILLKAYLAVSDEDAIDVIDLLSGNAINRLRIAPGDDPREVALTPDGRVLLTANFGTRTVSVIDTSRLVEVQRVPVGDGPRSLLIDGAGKRAYVFNTYSSTISVIDIPRMGVAATVPAELSPVRGQFNRRGDRLYVISSGSSYLSVIDVGTLSVVKKVFVGMGANAFKVDPRTDLLYVGRRQDDGVTVYNAVTFTPTYFIRAGGPVAYMTIDGEENRLYLAIPRRKVVSVIDLISRQVVGEIDVGEDPYWVTMMGER